MHSIYWQLTNTPIMQHLQLKEKWNNLAIFNKSFSHAQRTHAYYLLFLNVQIWPGMTPCALSGADHFRMYWVNFCQTCLFTVLSQPAGASVEVRGEPGWTTESDHWPGPLSWKRLATQCLTCYHRDSETGPKPKCNIALSHWQESILRPVQINMSSYTNNWASLKEPKLVFRICFSVRMSQLCQAVSVRCAIVTKPHDRNRYISMNC